METKGLKRRSFHETIVDAINRADDGVLEVLGKLIKETKIPKNHDKIIVAWNCALNDFDEDDEWGVLENLFEQKREAEENQAKKQAETAAS